jgi:hypothetical protein
MEALEAVAGLFRAFPDLRRADGAPEPVPMGFVSRVWRPVELAHTPADPATVRSRVLGPAAGEGVSAPGAEAAYGRRAPQS